MRLNLVKFISYVLYSDPITKSAGLPNNFAAVQCGKRVVCGTFIFLTQENTGYKNLLQTTLLLAPIS